MLIILDSNGPGGLAEAQRLLNRELDHPRKVIMLLRGEAPGMARLATDAGLMADSPWRVAIWLRSPDILDKERTAAFFGTSPSDVVVVLDLADTPVHRFEITARIDELDRGFRTALR